MLRSVKQNHLEVVDLGRLGYAEALDRQRVAHRSVVESREQGHLMPMPLMLVEHDPPVITVSRRPGSAAHLLADVKQLSQQGIEVQATDRGGDITYHGPGQLVAYPIFDLRRLSLGVHEYVRSLESIVIKTLASFDVHAMRDPTATGVWVDPEHLSEADANEARPIRKIAAIGIRVGRWVSMHGLALNVRTNLAHFDTIVPCGLAGRGVTSMEQLLGRRCPTMDEVKARLVGEFEAMVARSLKSQQADV